MNRIAPNKISLSKTDTTIETDVKLGFINKMEAKD